ncbi:FkbM family methyltransferase [Pedobacter punctiformis]|uniref:FkbM family methyltransferase n=1 Tax=Pedobacter punctiformis TaxID=3004097 RepID=A0ABT4L9V0_9SPHI|nr:FkbM family methyltransferase [Pedobacter sp. HCMS5-2]MCZ4244695.1 FkbM family methyltransferase [Pedobacter sp. HCMS5-2]
MYNYLKNKIVIKIRGIISEKRERFFLKTHNFKRFEDAKHFVIESDYSKITLRKQGSDWQVFKQIFQYKEYSPLLTAIKLNNIELSFILDLGANIGLTTIYIKKHYPDAQIVCVEPDANNFKQLTLNTAHFQNVHLIQAAVWNKSTLLTEDEPFRGGDDWSKSFKEDNENSEVGKIKGITIEEILKIHSKSQIDLLKIDIEGAERFIFDESASNLSFLDITKVIAIEIHDEFNIREKINNILISYNFVLFEVGELTIGIKK